MFKKTQLWIPSRSDQLLLLYSHDTYEYSNQIKAGYYASFLHLFALHELYVTTLLVPLWYSNERMKGISMLYTALYYYECISYSKEASKGFLDGYFYGQQVSQL